MKMKRLILALLTTVAIPAAAVAAPVVITVPLDGAISGFPGEVVGWGFTIQADPALWISFSDSFSLFESNPSLGFYTDFLGFQGGPVNFVLAPGAPDWLQNFDDMAGTGIGSFSIDPGALAGAVDSGVIHIDYQLFSADPNVCNGSCGAGAGSVDVPFQVTVASAPEPKAGLLAAAGIAWILLRRRRHS